MRSVGQFCLLVALICAGYAAFLFVGGTIRRRVLLGKTAVACLAAAVGALTVVVAILAWALVTKDFSFAYVADYSSNLLPWNYSLSALWVGQAGSLLLWAWLVGALAVVFRFLPARDAALRDMACGIVLAYLAFLLGVILFAADPMEASLHPTDEGLGLSPLLQHPSMLIHPPVVFFAYAAWTIPFALAIAALLLGRLDAAWTQMARPWAILGWCLLGGGLLLGAHWAYQELGWGGYWGWDPVENGSLLPWLTGTAFIHCLMAWRFRRRLKKTALALAILTFGLCNFATFLTRSGVFSSVHAFSQSPIGWMFLGLMAALVMAGGAMIHWRREALRGEGASSSIWARESLIGVSAFLFLLLTAVVLAGTLMVPLSTRLAGRTVQVGPAFYNNVLAPIGITVLALTAAVPLLRWGRAPGVRQGRALAACLAVAAVAALLAFALGVRNGLLLGVLAIAMLTTASLAAALLLDSSRRGRQRIAPGLLRTLRDHRRTYAGYVVHVGIMILAIGVTGSALGTQRREAVMNEGDTLTWAGREIHYIRLVQRETPEKLIAEAELRVRRGDADAVTLFPARHLHLLQNEWTTEVAIHSTWRGDFYTILNAGLGEGQVALTLIDNPLVPWIWAGGLICLGGAVIAMWPSRAARWASMEKSLPGASAATSDRSLPQRRAA